MIVLELGKPVWSVAFSPDGRLLAAGDNRGVLRVWSLSALLGQGGRSGDSDRICLP